MKKISPDETRVRQQTPAERVEHMLEEFDTNKDGKLSKDEVPEGMRDRFDAADTNHDGFLDLEELKRMFSNMPPQGNNGRGSRQDNDSKGQPK